jgi:hypothetical protein
VKQHSTGFRLAQIVHGFPLSNADATRAKVRIQGDFEDFAEAPPRISSAVGTGFLCSFR